MKKYLLFVSHSYAYSILRPIQTEIRKRGSDVAWFVEDTSPLFLREDEKHLKTISEVMAYNPYAIFAPGNHIYDFFPGIKVEVFHGFDINKRQGRGSHYSIRGWFDLYCTQGNKDTLEFDRLSKKYNFFKAIQTGWSKLDSFFDSSGHLLQSKNEKPVILYASTFTSWITSTPYLYDEIERLILKGEYSWLITFHPKMDKAIVEKYKKLSQYSNVLFYEGANNVELLTKADVLICDSSSIIIEFLYLNKPVVTYKNTSPGNHLLDIDDSALLSETIEKALQRPADLMENIAGFMEQVHPFRDGQSSARIVDAVDYFATNYKGKLKKKPLNLFRKLKLRKKAGYFPFGTRQ